MTKKELSKKILDRYTQDEWEALEKDTLGVPVNKSNREVLLKFKEDSAALDDTSGRRRPNISNRSANRMPIKSTT